ncbi:MAG: ion transporter [Chloroflexota bacterium]
MDSLSDHLKVKTLQNHSMEVREIRRNARNWRLMDCTVDTLEKMRHAVIEEIEKVEGKLKLENSQFIDFIDSARPIEAEETRENIETLTNSWQEFNKHLGDIDNAILERQLQLRLIKLFRGRKGYIAFEVIVTIAIIAVIGLVIFELSSNLTEPLATQILLVETGISIFLLCEFFLRLSLSSDRGWYFRRYWVDFVASLPISILHFGRVFQFARFLRLLRLLRIGSTIRTVSHVFRGLDKIIKTFQLNLLKRSLFIAILLLLFGAFSISAIEVPFNNDLSEWRESFWWSFTTVVTGGFADLYNPETAMGRLITVGLVLVGFVVTSVFTASLTSVLMEDDSSRIERNQKSIEGEMEAIQQKLDLLSGQTNQGLIALEVVAQQLSNQSDKTALAKILVEALLQHFEIIHASVHLWNDDTAVLETTFQQGDGRIVYDQTMPLDNSVLGQTMAALVDLENPASLDIEPITESLYDLALLRMICPMVAHNQVVGAVQVILPEEHGRYYLYNRAPQTLAHHSALAFKLLA